MVHPIGVEPINGVFSPFPRLASFSDFIAHRVKAVFNDYRH
jgi:hypothetical protein